MTKEEFIGIAADAILAQRVGRLLVAQVNDEVRYEAVQWATAALDAVGAWELYEGACAAEYAAECRGDQIERGRWAGRLRKAEGRS